MDAKQLEKLMRLARKTGDTLIVTDPEGDTPMVLLPFDKYEELLGEGKRQPEAVYEESIPEDDYERQVEGEEDDLPMLDKIAPGFRPEGARESRVTEPARPEPRKEPVLTPESTRARLESLAKKRQKDEGGEERFYLEPIE